MLTDEAGAELGRWLIVRAAKADGRRYVSWAGDVWTSPLLIAKTFVFCVRRPDGALALAADADPNTVKRTQDHGPLTPMTRYVRKVSVIRDAQGRVVGTWCRVRESRRIFRLDNRKGLPGQVPSVPPGRLRPPHFIRFDGERWAHTRLADAFQAFVLVRAWDGPLVAQLDFCFGATLAGIEDGDLGEPLPMVRYDKPARREGSGRR